MAPTHVAIGSVSPRRFGEVMDEGQERAFLARLERTATMLQGRCVWNVNSTPRGGGVAEMLRSLLAYTRGGGVDARWVAIEGEPEFFRVTKRLHNHLHGAPGDGGDLGAEERRVYDRAQAANAAELVPLISPGDVVLVHDPQPAGLCEPLKQAGAKVIWRCHVGLDEPNDVTRRAWRFLHPYVAPADAYVFSRRAFVWEDLDEDRVWIVPPSIDAFSPKNQALEDDVVLGILDAAGIVARPGAAAPVYLREDGTPGRVDRRAELVEDAPLPPGAPVVLQISRWDRLKDPVGVIRGFAEHAAPHCDAHLLYAGPAVDAVADDPEGAEVLAESRAAWEGLPADARARIHLAHLPMGDGAENAAIVNALQRYATVVVQKSIAEGFGLTVAEAMWKGKPVVATRIGGIQDQIEHGISGVLVGDPHDLATFGREVVSLLDDEVRAAAIGGAARARVRSHFLGPRHLLQYMDLVERLIS